ncbi:MAG: glutamate synthase large subunit, partial [Pseudomonadota bacterium]|nr:glutamate synthase large subunit [Pseudomonadota bacterium]
KPEGIENQDSFERKIYVLRQCIDNAIHELGDKIYDQFYIPSFSSRTILYKGMVLSDQVGTVGNRLGFFEDLADPLVESSFALIHQRFSTNTFPTWSLAQPFRMICHNGEINTLRGNINWMNARHSILKSNKFKDDIEKLWPIIKEGQSDSASFDNALELLVLGGYSISEAMLIMIPEAWQNNNLMNEDLKKFYEYHAPLMEPWDGPANIAFTDGKQIGAMLDRNGLRPARYLVTKDNKVIFASEMGLIPVEEDQIISKWRLQPGKMLLIDLEKKSIIDDQEIKRNISEKNDWKRMVQLSQLDLNNISEAEDKIRIENSLSQLKLLQAYGYTQEDESFLMNPMVQTGAEGTGSMGTDTPVSALSSKSKLLYTYFKQNFAQVTNPPIDPIREEIVMSLINYIGKRGNILDLESLDYSNCIKIDQPILKEKDLCKIIEFSEKNSKKFMIKELDITFEKKEKENSLEEKLISLCKESEKNVNEGSNILILSDKNISESNIAIPALLAVSAVHHHLVDKGLRTSTGLIIETAEAREIHHFCCLAGYGADAISPWLALRQVEKIAPDLKEEAQDNYIKACGKGMLKVMSKMGISTYQSYCGAQIFDAIGLSSELIKKYFFGTSSKVEGINLKEIEQETISRHNTAFEDIPTLKNLLDVGGEYALRMRGEEHAWNSDSVRDLQHAVRSNNSSTYKDYAKQINDQDKRLMTLRGLFKFKNPKEYGRSAIEIDEVEDAKEIVKRFATGAMSFGSISREAHTNLAIAMNRIGGKSNTGEGGEEVDRFNIMENGDSMRSAIKQVASGRFGVTAEYLSNSDMIQIKMAQGAKPGEGGQLPGHKVDKTIAKVRYSTPGVGLISPPPHHDIYSIEDLAQLIYDLKNANPDADISVKLVSEVGVGTVAAGVSKAKADHVTISGFEGGTGASPLTSIKHAGSPWEIGLAETHQTLVLNGLRSRIAVQVDGGLRTGRDVVIGALLGA